MFENPFSEKITALIEGITTELVIEQSDFMLFREAWLRHPNRKEIIGTAGLNGQIIYNYKPIA